MGDSTEEHVNRLREVTAHQMRQLYHILEEARARKETVTENDIEYWLRPALHLVFVTLSSLSERLTNLEDYVVRPWRGRLAARRRLPT